VIIELQEQLLAQGKELDSREGTVFMWEESLIAFAHVLREASTEHDASRAHVDAVRRDYSAQVSMSSSQSEWHKALGRTLDEHTTLFGLQEMNLELREAILVEELERGLHPSDGRTCQWS
jgi:cysteine sulfinate desulfinase/cysteine desulfurase-like protein